MVYQYARMPNPHYVFFEASHLRLRTDDAREAFTFPMISVPFKISAKKIKKVTGVFVMLVTVRMLKKACFFVEVWRFMRVHSLEATLC